MTNRPVLSLGETLIDLIVDDGAPSLLTAQSFAARAGGAPANVAVAVARLGVASAFGGVVGRDPFGERLERELYEEGVDTSPLRRSNEAATALAFAWKDRAGDGHFWLIRGADTLLTPGDIDAAGIERYAALVIGSVSLAVQPSRSAILHAVQRATASTVPVVFDINYRPTVWSSPTEATPLCQDVARFCSLVKLSLDDAVGLYGAGTSPELAISRLLGLGPAAVVVTDGERGCWFGTQQNPVSSFVPAFDVQAIEPTGSGDAFCAGLIARLLESDWALLSRDDVVFATAAGALATTKRGAWEGLPSRPQLDAFLEAAAAPRQW